MPSATSIGSNDARATRVVRIPQDLEDGGHLYMPLPEDHFSAKNAINIMGNIADEIERVVSPKEPYEISMLGLRDSVLSVPQPVLTIGIASSERLVDTLLGLQIPYVVHLSSHYPTSFSNAADRNPRPDQLAGLQHDVPAVGSSCGLLADDRHSVTLGSYVRLSSSPKAAFMLTAPLSVSPSVLVAKGNAITQPSVADRECLNESEDRYWRDVLKQDIDQAAAVAMRREELQKVFELGRTVASASGLRQGPEPSMAEGSMQFDAVFDGSLTQRNKDQTPACPSNSWAIVQVTRATTLAILAPTKKRWLFGGGPSAHSHVHALVPGLLVSKTGRTTGRTIGTVNGVKSLYRLPRDGTGVRRYDYPVVSATAQPFSFPGDAGAVVLTQSREDMEETKANNTGKPCALIVGSSTRGHIAFVQDMESVVAGVKAAGLGNMSFINIDV